MSAAGPATQFGEKNMLILDKIDEAMAELDKIASANSSLEEKDVLCNAVMRSVFKVAMNESLTYLKILDQFKYSKDEAQDDELTKEYLSFSQEDQKVVIKAMQLACKAGITMESKDLYIRQKWLEKLMSVSY